MGGRETQGNLGHSDLGQPNINQRAPRNGRTDPRDRTTGGFIGLAWGWRLKGR